MDAAHNSKPDHASTRILIEKLSEKTHTGIGSPISHTNHLSVDTLAAALRPGSSDSPATAARTPDRQTVEETVRFQHFTTRTLPGSLPAPVTVSRMSLTNSFHSLDPISRSTL